MGVFDDKEYEALDWISQAVEPIKSPMNGMLAKLPDELIIDFALYRSFNDNDYSVGLDLSGALEFLVEQYCRTTVTGGDKDLLGSCFQFTVEEGAAIDFDKKKIFGIIKLTKIKKQIDEKELQNRLGEKGLYELSRMLSWRQEENDLTRINDIIEILDVTHESRTSRSLRKKLKGIQHMLKDIMKQNKWNIKDAALADKLCTWVGLYISDGNLAAYTNVCRLKLMTHKGVAIYSMAEDKV